MIYGKADKPIQVNKLTKCKRLFPFLKWFGTIRICWQEKKRRIRKWVGGLSFQGFFFSFYPGSKRNICIFWYDMSQVEDVWYLSANIFHAPLFCLWIHTTTFEELKTVTDGGRWTRISYLNVWFCKFSCLYITRNEVSNLLLGRMMV